MFPYPELPSNLPQKEWPGYNYVLQGKGEDQASVIDYATSNNPPWTSSELYSS